MSFGAQQSVLELIFAHFKREAKAQERNILGILIFYLSSLISQGKCLIFIAGVSDFHTSFSEMKAKRAF